jgi:hypothetical protein
MIAERVRAGLREPEVKESASGAPQLLPHWKSESVRPSPGRPGVRVLAKRFGVNPGTEMGPRLG